MGLTMQAVANRFNHAGRANGFKHAGRGKWVSQCRPWQMGLIMKAVANGFHNAGCGKLPIKEAPPYAHRVHYERCLTTNTHRHRVPAL